MSTYGVGLYMGENGKGRRGPDGLLYMVDGLVTTRRRIIIVL